MAVRPLTLSAFLSLPLWELSRAHHMLHVCTAASDNQIYAGFYSYHIARSERRYRSWSSVLNQKTYSLTVMSCVNVHFAGCYKGPGTCDPSSDISVPSLEDAAGLDL